MGKMLHRLSGIDHELAVGVCSTCGPVALKQRSSGQRVGGKHWRCSISESRWNNGGSGRKLYRAHLKPRCERCGFVAKDRVQLDINHRDGDCANGSPENLETVCANCHRLLTKLEGHSKNRRRKNGLRPRWIRVLPALKKGEPAKRALNSNG